LVKGKYNPEVVFHFYSSSGDQAPGKGARETIPKELEEEYKELERIPHWRKKLSNFAEAPFELDGLHWNSVEHYYQASKFKHDKPDFYKSFSLESGSELSKNPKMAKAAGGKTGKYQGKVIRTSKIKIDSDFFEGEKPRTTKEMYLAQSAKFTQNEEMKNLLLATKEAYLLHILSRKPISIPFDNLMYIREKMKEDKI
jgi:predicted NAD-dependent protein-ADP-ribosyltransferase YbiA (DUF1768 family)